MKYCLILGGPIYEKSIKFIELMCKNVPTIITTWDDEPLEKILLLKKISIDIVLNKKPLYNGNQNINCANFSLVNGFKRAKDLGYLNVLRFRTDLYSPEIKLLCKIFSKTNLNKLSSLCWFNHFVEYSPYGYIMDHVMYGPVDLMIKYRNVEQKIGDNTHTEAFLQNNYFMKTNVTYEDVKEDFCFVLHELSIKKIKIFFTNKYNDDDLISLYKNLNTIAK